MFTGIVQDIGIVTDIVKSGDWLIKIKTDKLSLAETKIGASISCAGVCLTVIEKSQNIFNVQVSAETLSKTTIARWGIGTGINLEPALRLGDELGGHMVTGHIDGFASVALKQKEGDSLRLKFTVPAELARFVVPKGSVAIDGVSLTINEVEGARFGVNLIPHTQAVTTLGTLSVGDNVNLEVDIMARYAARLLQNP
jgi:riboflavin synthase